MAWATRRLWASTLPTRSIAAQQPPSLPGFGNFSINPNYPVDLATNANFTIEQPLKWNSALRVSYVWSHGANLDQYFYYNNHPSSFVWEMQNGKTTPNGGASVIGTPAANTYSVHRDRALRSDHLGRQRHESEERLVK